MTPSNLRSTSSSTASTQAKATQTPSTTIKSIATITIEITRLAETILRDREVHVSSNRVLLDAFVPGDGLVDFQVAGDADDDGDVAMGEAESLEQSLFVQADPRGDPTDGDAEYVDDADATDEDEEMSMEESDTECAAEVTWLNHIKHHITNLHATQAATIPCPHLAIQPKDYQNTALAKIEYTRDSSLKAVMIGDPPGLGKTLPAMMAMVKAISKSKRFSIAVVPPSCLDQWKAEFEKFFLPDAVQVLVLRDSSTSPMTLFKYDVILMSYPFVMSQYRKLQKYLSGVGKAQETGRVGHLERPSLTIFSDIFSLQEGVKCPYLVLDEVNAVKNSSSITFAAIQKLRSLADTCVMLTGSPVDNTWMDIYAYLQFLQDHTIRSRRIMRLLFAHHTIAGKLRPPTGNKFSRFVQLLNSFIVRRPEEILDLPALHERTVTFSLTSTEEGDSNHHFQKYLDIKHMSKKDGVQQAAELRMAGWGQLTKASQHASHPELVRIMHLTRDSTELGIAQASDDALYEAKDIEEWIVWKERLLQDDTWRSSRITALIDVFNELRDTDPECSLLIFDESVYFLDIVQIALANMYDPIECTRYDGRQAPEKRNLLLRDFEETRGIKVLLISRAAGGVGLNIPAANIVILLNPWWKMEWERQAIKRAHRPGQLREVFVIRLSAENCNVEQYKAGLRNKKDRHNSKIIKNVTREDGNLPQVWHDL